MGLFLKITTTTVLLGLVLHPVHPQNTSETTATTEMPRRTINQTWLREKVFPRPVANEVASTDERGTEVSGGESEGTDSSGGTPSGFMWFATDDNMTDTSEYTTEPPVFPSETTLAPETQDDVSTTTQMPNGDANMTATDTANNSTVLETDDAVLQNSTYGSNGTEIQTTTPALERNETDATDDGSGEGFTNEMENDATTTSQSTSSQSTSSQSTSSQSTTTEPTVPETTTEEDIEWSVATETSTSSPSETTTSAPVTSDRGNLSDKGAAGSGGAAERGFASESEKRKKKGAWGGVLGTFVAIAVVGMVAYVILKKKHHKAFSHRKLEEDFPADPVLRLDNSEPLDLNFGRAAYYNPALQGDSIQMSPFPKH